MKQITNDLGNMKRMDVPFGFYRNLLMSTGTPGGMNNNDGRTSRKNGTIPARFYARMRDNGIIKKDTRIPEEGTTVGELLDFLKCHPFDSEWAQAAGDYIFRNVIKADIPFIAKVIANKKDI